MALQCLTWIQHLRGLVTIQNKLFDRPLVTIQNNLFVRPLPDDIIIDILSRLPAECVLQCRRVCRRWFALTSTPSFVELHLKRAASMLLVHCEQFGGKKIDELDLFIIDERAKRDRVIQKMRVWTLQFGKVEDPAYPALFGSCNGLLLFCSLFYTSSVVCNPVTGEQLTISSPARRGFVCGFFFHPLTKEYKLLYVHREAKSKYIQYVAYSLGDSLWRKVGRTVPYGPRAMENPVIVNGALHWMVEYRCKNENKTPCNNSIMMLNMDTEDFRSMPHPGILECKSALSHKNMHLLEMEGKLSLCVLTVNLINGLWVLEDYESWFWVKKYKVNLAWDVGQYPFHQAKFYPGHTNSKISHLSFQDDELLLDWYSRGLFRYNLG